MKNVNEHIDGIILDDENGTYDAAAKSFLSEKIILGWLLKYCVSEFKGCKINEIAEKYIGNDVEVSKIPIEPDKTNAVKKIIGENVEYKTMTEGTTTFDIRFSAYAPITGEKLKLIINVEAQKKYNPGYSILKRGIFHCSRLLSSQYNVEFVEPEFDKIKKVYSIWLCMTSPESKISAATQYLIREKNLIGKINNDRKNYDLLQVIMIYIGSDDKKIEHKLLKMLYLIFRAKMKAQEKEKKLKEEFDVELNSKMAKELNIMCNLSEGIAEEAKTEGIIEGTEKTILKNLRSIIKNTNSTEVQAMDILDIPNDEREKYIQMLKIKLS